MPDITNETEMKDFTLNIIEVLHKAKKDRNLFPDHVTRNEILHFIGNKVERALKTLESENVVNSGESMGYQNRYYELQK